MQLKYPKQLFNLTIEYLFGSWHIKNLNPDPFLFFFQTIAYFLNCFEDKMSYFLEGNAFIKILGFNSNIFHYIELDFQMMSGSEFLKGYYFIAF